MTGRIDFNGKRCVWCRSCELICSLHHDAECSPGLARIHVLLDLFEAEAEGYVCRQCDEPECLHSCPVGAIQMNEDTGAYVISENECTACGLCADACPYNADKNIIFLNPRKNTYVKCDLCSGKPQCIEICPSEALKLTVSR